MAENNIAKICDYHINNNPDIPCPIIDEAFHNNKEKYISLTNGICSEICIPRKEGEEKIECVTKNMMTEQFKNPKYVEYIKRISL